MSGVVTACQCLPVCDELNQARSWQATGRGLFRPKATRASLTCGDNAGGKGALVGVDTPIGLDASVGVAIRYRIFRSVVSHAAIRQAYRDAPISSDQKEII